MYLLITSTTQHNLIPMPFALVDDNFVDLLLPRGLLAITLFAAVGVGKILPWKHRNVQPRWVRWIKGNKKHKREWDGMGRWQTCSSAFSANFLHLLHHWKKNKPRWVKLVSTNRNNALSAKTHCPVQLDGEKCGCPDRGMGCTDWPSRFFLHSWWKNHILKRRREKSGMPAVNPVIRVQPMARRKTYPLHVGHKMVLSMDIFTVFPL